MSSYSVFQYSWSLHRSGHTEMALGLLNKHLIVESRWKLIEGLHHTIAHILMDAGRSEEAVEPLQTVLGIHLDPDDLPVVEFNSPMLLEDLFTATAIAGAGD